MTMMIYDDDANNNVDDAEDRSIFRAITLARGTEGTRLLPEK